MAIKKQVVKYTGLADVRTFTVRDWRMAGVESASPVEVSWHAGNQWTVDRRELGFLTDDEFERFIRRDGRFVVLDADA